MPCHIYVPLYTLSLHCSIITYSTISIFHSNYALSYLSSTLYSIVLLFHSNLLHHINLSSKPCSVISVFHSMFYGITVPSELTLSYQCSTPIYSSYQCSTLSYQCSTPIYSSYQCSTLTKLYHINVPPSLCSITLMFQPHYALSYPCSTLTMLYHINVPASLCSIISMFHPHYALSH